jgi:hypothetical protein
MEFTDIHNGENLQASVLEEPVFLWGLPPGRLAGGHMEDPTKIPS